MNRLLKLTTLSLLLGLTYQAHTKELSDKFLRQISEKYALPGKAMPVSSIRYYQEVTHFTTENEDSEPTPTAEENLITDINIHPTQYHGIFQVDSQDSFAINGRETQRFSSLDLYPGHQSLSINSLALDDKGELTISGSMQLQKLFLSQLPSQWESFTPFEARTEYRIQTSSRNWKHGKKISFHATCKAFPAETVHNYPRLFPRNVEGMVRLIECTSFGYNQKNQLYRQSRSRAFWLENYQLVVPLSDEIRWEGEKSFTRIDYRMLDFKP